MNILDYATKVNVEMDWNTAASAAYKNGLITTEELMKMIVEDNDDYIALDVIGKDVVEQWYKARKFTGLEKKPLYEEIHNSIYNGTLASQIQSLSKEDKFLLIKEVLK